jgi:hypothetical protein
MTMNAKRIPMKIALAAVLAGTTAVAGAQMSGPMMTTNYFPLLDGARYDYTFLSGPHTAATAVMHGGQQWAGMVGLTALHMTFTCLASVPCDRDHMDFYGMGPDGMHYYGGSGATPDDNHYMMSFTSPEWVLKNPVMPGTMMGPGMGYQNAEMWQVGVAGMNTMMGPQGYMSTYQALALETVVTPAGTFTGALHVHERHGNGYERDVWYAADVGMIRWVDSHEEAVLARFTKATGPVPKTVMAIEYYNSALDHYFVTADPAEMTALDSGRFIGWQRTGMGFNVFDPSESSPMTMPVCRFYGNPAYGLDTHFYSASGTECADIMRNWPAQWTLESSNVFRMALPDMMSGSCPMGTMAVYRTWNQRADTNHRYTTDPAVQGMMMNHGNVAEGYGNPPVAMCSPQ